MFIKVLTVTQITSYIKKILSSDPILNNVSVKGEISNFKHHFSGHMYFTLKDDAARIKCVMFKSSCASIKFLPEDGMNVIISGSISLYERDGQYQLYVLDMQPDGVGALYMAFEQLKKKLEAEGLFDAQNKTSIPKYPSSVGVITSSTGAAVRDIINVISRRYPCANIKILPVLVQGIGASEEISHAIETLNKRADVDVIIVGRGGGSIEELWAFNEENVARAIYNSKIPIISAVGHETDFTISDFVADLRAPTPSAAAELCVPDINNLFYKVNTCFKSLCNLALANIRYKQNSLNKSGNMLLSMNPMLQISQKRQYIDSLDSRLLALVKYKLDIKREKLQQCSTNLDILSPLSIITRGYSVSYISGTKKVLKDVKKVKVGDNIDVLLKNGSLKCIVDGIMEGDINCEESK